MRPQLGHVLSHTHVISMSQALGDGARRVELMNELVGVSVKGRWPLNIDGCCIIRCVVGDLQGTSVGKEGPPSSKTRQE